MRILNRKARHKFHILSSLEAGIVLSGFEVKSVRNGRVDLSEGFAKIQNGEIFLKNCYIYPFQQVKDYDPRRDRKLLLHKKEIDSLIGKTSKSSVYLVPLSMYIKHNYIKVELGVGQSKKKYDKRRAIKERDQQKRIEQELRSVK